MNIGVDIDNVISDYDNCFLQECLQYDKKLRNNGIINKNILDAFTGIYEGMFDWTLDEADLFYKNNVERIAINLTTIPHSKEYIDKLKSDGHKIIIITARDFGAYSDPHTLTRTWLFNNHIYYDKLIITKGSSLKLKECIENNIHLMIDDSKTVYQDCIKNDIPALLMDTVGNRDINATRVYSWKEIYDIISNGGYDDK